jgi:hypothetical protein
MQTNNPRKMAFLRALDVEVTGRVPCIVQAQQYSEGYLAVKVGLPRASLTIPGNSLYSMCSRLKGNRRHRYNDE